jgi:hypothetical protein
MKDTAVIPPPIRTQDPKLGSQYDDLAQYVYALIHECEKTGASGFSMGTARARHSGSRSPS